MSPKRRLNSPRRHPGLSPDYLHRTNSLVSSLSYCLPARCSVAKNFICRVQAYPIVRRLWTALHLVAARSVLGWSALQIAIDLIGSYFAAL